MNIKPSQIQAEFPYKALGEILGDAVKGISDTVQAPIAIAGQAVLTTAALIAQGHANVKMDHRVYPLSLFGLTIAGSGDRKTSMEKLETVPSKVVDKFDAFMSDEDQPPKP